MSCLVRSQHSPEQTSVRCFDILLFLIFDIRYSQKSHGGPLDTTGLKGPVHFSMCVCVLCVCFRVHVLLTVMVDPYWLCMFVHLHLDSLKLRSLSSASLELGSQILQDYTA